MIVCDKLRVLFTHNTKTGGSSVTEALMKHISSVVDAKELRPPGTRGWQGQYHVNGQHSDWSSVESWARPRIEQGWIHIAAHRNPYTRVASMFHAWRSRLDISLWEWMSIVPPGHKSKAHLKPACEQAGPFVTDWLEFEELERCWLDLVVQHNLQHVPVYLPKLDTGDMTTPRPPLHELYADPRTVHWVQQMYEHDFRKFGYSLGLPDR